MMRGDTDSQAGDIDPKNIILKIQTGNPFVCDEKGFTYLHIAAKYCLPEVALWMFYAGPIQYLSAASNGVTPFDLAERHGHHFISHLLAPPQPNSIYELAILLWMLKHKHAPFDGTLKKFISRILGEDIKESVIQDIRSKITVKPLSASDIIQSDDIYIKAVEDYKEDFVRNIKKSTILAINALGSLLFLVSDGKDIYEIAHSLLIKRKFELLILWMITNNIHPYEIISSLKNEDLIYEFCAEIWSLRGVLAYTIYQIIVDPANLKHVEFFQYLPKSDKVVFRIFLSCLIEKNRDPNCIHVINELLKPSGGSISALVANLKNIKPDVAKYFNDYFMKLNLPFQIGQQKYSAKLPNEAIMHMLGVRKKPVSEHKDEDEKDNYESQPSIPSMLTRREINKLARASRNLFYLTHRVPKKTDELKNKLSAMNVQIQENNSALETIGYLRQGINEILDQIKQEQESKNYCQHRSWPMLSMFGCCGVLVSTGFALCCYVAKLSFDGQYAAIDQLKDITITIANTTKSCFDWFFVNNTCSGGFSKTACKYPCEDYTHYANMSNGSIIGLIFLGSFFLANCAGCVEEIADQFRRGSERFDRISVSNYSSLLQGKINEILENKDMRQSIGSIKDKANTSLVNLNREYQERETKRKYLSGVHSLITKRYNLFKPKPSAGVGLGFSVEENVDSVLDSKLPVPANPRFSQFPSELTVPLLQEELSEEKTSEDKSQKTSCIIQ